MYKVVIAGRNKAIAREINNSINKRGSCFCNDNNLSNNFVPFYNLAIYANTLYMHQP